MAFASERAEMVVHAADADTPSKSTVGMAYGDNTVPTLEDAHAFVAASAADLREFLDGAMNRVDARIVYTDDAAAGAGAGSEVERRAVLKLTTAAGIEAQLSIPGVKPSLFAQGSLNTSDPDVAALLDALSGAGIGGIVPVDSHGDTFTGVSAAYKQHRRSTRG